MDDLFFDAEIPTYLCRLQLFAGMTNADRATVIDLLSNDNKLQIEKEIVTYRAHLRKQIQCSIDMLPNTSTLDNLKMHDMQLADIAHAVISDLFPPCSIFCKTIGVAEDYRVFKIIGGNK